MRVTFDVPVFDVKHLSLTLNGQTILQNVSFQLKRGEYSALIGPNGGGKTTLVRILLGLQKADRGAVRLFGVEQKRFRRWDKIGFVPQRVSHVDISFPATVLEVVRMGRTAKRGLFGRESDEDREAVEEAMHKMDVKHLEDRLIGTLSGGQRQRVMIARALASRPEVLILDEPNTGVDMASQQRFYTLLRELNRKEKMTILFITHDIGVIADDIGSLLCINRSLLSCSNPKELLSCSDMSRIYGIDAHLVHHHH